MVVPASNPYRVSILGVTGSVGQNTKDIILSNKAAYDVQVVTGGNNVKALAEAAQQLQARYAVIAEDGCYAELKQALSGTEIQVKAGRAGMLEAMAQKVDWVMSAISGSVALEPTMEAIQTGARIALANKECLVCAGSLMKEAAHKSGAIFLPVDSEHSAIFQVLHQRHIDNISRIILTASGGPFRSYTHAQLSTVTMQQALMHPNWSMGQKITIDSATMMNKGLEVIEAYHLFPVTIDQIDVVVHPQSIVHGMVEYTDGSMLAQLGNPDMRTPIAVALAWPGRIDITHTPLSFTQLSQLTFEPVDNIHFPALKLAYDAVKQGGAAPLILNTANEVAVEYFLNHRIGFLQITQVVAHMLETITSKQPQTIAETLALIDEIKTRTTENIAKIQDPVKRYGMV